MVGDSPSYPRVILGEALKRRREQEGVSQKQIAGLLGCTQPKVARLETAQIKTIKMAELDLILGHLGIEGAEAEELRKLARSPYAERGVWVDTYGKQPWWDGKLRGERLVSSYHSVHVEVHDGLLQSEGYMRRQFELGGRTDATAATRGRLDRQRAFFEREVPPEAEFIMSEAALHRDMGDPAMMGDELEHLLSLSSQPNLSVVIVPFTAPVPPQLFSFTIFRFDSSIMTDFVLIEHAVGLAVLDEPDALRDYMRRLAQVRSGALTEHDSRALIKQRLDHYRSQV